MKQILKIYIPSACITFTMTVIFTCILNLFQGYTAMNNTWFLQLLGFILVIDVIDFAFGYVNFKSYRVYFITELILTYAVMLLFGYFGYWFVFTAQKILTVTVLFLVIYSCIQSYFRRMSHMQADEINKLLADK